MGIEGGSNNNELQNQEINQANNEQIEQNQAEHQRSGSELEGNSTIDNEGERKQIEGKDDATESQEDEASKLDNDDKIEDELSQENQSDMDMSEQQLDNQNVIEGENSLTDGSIGNEKEEVDSLDAEDTIEDGNDKDGLEEENVNSSDALDDYDTIESDDDKESDSENNKADDAPLDTDDKIEDDKKTYATEKNDEVGGESEDPEESDSDGKEIDDSEATDATKEKDNVGGESENPEEPDNDVKETDDSEATDATKEKDNVAGESDKPKESDSDGKKLDDTETTDDTKENDSIAGGTEKSEEPDSDGKELDDREATEDTKEKDNIAGETEKAKEPGSDGKELDDTEATDDTKENDKVIGEAEKSEGDDNRDKELDRNLDKPNGTEGVDATDNTPRNREGELWGEQGKMAKDAFDSADAPIEKDRYGNDYKPLSREEAKELSDKLKSQMDEVQKGEGGNYRVPEPEKIKGVSVSDKGDVRIAENWKDGTDGAKPGTRHMETVKAEGADGKPTVIDRVGGENGNYFSPMNPDGEPYSLKERAIGDYLPNENIQDNDSYHQYEVKQDFTRENFEKAINDTYDDPDIREDKMDSLNAYYNDASSDSYTNGHDGERYYDGTPDQADGVKTGEIDQMFLEDGDEYGKGTDGGGTQYITPFSAKELKEMGMIEEI